MIPFATQTCMLHTCACMHTCSVTLNYWKHLERERCIPCASREEGG